MYYVYVLCICICKNKITITTGPGGTGGSGKVKSIKGDNTLREGRKGDPLHECCGGGQQKPVSFAHSVFSKTPPKLKDLK